MSKALVRLVPAALALVVLSAGPARAAGREAVIVGSAIEVIEQANAIPERGIPASLLKDAAGVAIFPNIIKAGFIIGGKHGRGVVLVRTKDGGWSNPVFLTLTAGSIGWQVGAQSTDLVLVFKTGRSVERILENRGKLTLGADIGVAAGPVGRQAAAATDVQLKAEIYSYSRSRGLFAGASFEGAGLFIDWNANGWFYGRRGATPSEIVTNNGVLIPEVALRLRTALTTLTNPPPPAPPPVIEIKPGPPIIP
jgi:lipid-binding SYLF domain-containing protein